MRGPAGELSVGGEARAAERAAVPLEYEVHLAGRRIKDPGGVALEPEVAAVMNLQLLSFDGGEDE